MSNEKEIAYVIPTNFDDSLLSSWGIKKRNVIEAVIGLVIVLLPLFFIPMPLKIKAALGVIFLVPWLFLSIKGIRNYSITEYFKNRYKYQTSQKKIKSKPLFADYEEQEGDYFISDYLGILRHENGVIETTDGRCLTIVEISSIDIDNKEAEQKEDIIEFFKAWLLIAPIKMQIKTVARKSDIEPYITELKNEFKSEKNEFCKIMQDDHIAHIRNLNNTQAVEHRFFIILEYESKHKDYTFVEAKDWLMQAKTNARVYLKNCGNHVIDHSDEDLFITELFYILLNRADNTDTLVNKTKLLYNKAFNAYNGDSEKLRNLNIPIDDLVISGSIEFHPDYVKANNTYFSFLYIPSVEYPEYVTGGWMAGLTAMGVGIDVDVFIDKPDAGKVKNKLHSTQRLSFVRLNSMRQKGTEGDNVASTQKAYFAGEYIKNKMQSGEPLFNVSTLITITSSSLSDLVAKVAGVETVMRTNNIETKDMYYKMFELFKSYLPLCKIDDTLYEKSRRNVPLSGLSSFYCFTSYEISDPGGTLLGVNRDNQSLYINNPYYSKRYKNANIAIIGTTGAGKTFLLQTMGIRNRLKGIQTFFLVPEKGHEYKLVAQKIGGEFISLSPGSKHCINIMEIRYVDTSNRELLEAEAFSIPESFLAQKIEQLHLFFQLIYPDISFEDKEYLDSALLETYRKKGIGMDNESLISSCENGKVIYKEMPILSDLYNELVNTSETSRLALVLKRFVSGSASGFNGQTNVDLNNKYVVIDVTKLASSSLLEVGMFIALDYIWDKIREDCSVKKSIILDEVWKMLESTERSGKFVQDIFKLIRGYAGSAVAATQNILDCDSKYGKAILNNTKTKYLMQLEEEELKKAAEILGLTDAERRIVKTLGHNVQGEALVKASDNTLVVQIKASPLEESLLKTNVEDVQKELLRKKSLVA